MRLFVLYVNCTPHKRVCAFAHTYIHIHTHTLAHTHTHTHLYINFHTHAVIRTNAFIYSFKYICTIFYLNERTNGCMD